MFSYICMANVMRKEMNLERIYLERLRKGSYKDFTKLYELYVSRLYAFALGLTHSDVLAKDIVQETFIKVWIRREQIDPDMSFRSFLFTMAKNQLLNEFRRQANSPLFLEDIAFVESGECEETAIERKLSLEDNMSELIWLGVSMITVGGVKERSSSIWMATRNTRQSVEQVRRIISAARITSRTRKHISTKNSPLLMRECTK